MRFFQREGRESVDLRSHWISCLCFFASQLNGTRQLSITNMNKKRICCYPSNQKRLPQSEHIGCGHPSSGTADGQSLCFTAGCNWCCTKRAAIMQSLSRVPSFNVHHTETGDTLCGEQTTCKQPKKAIILPCQASQSLVSSIRGEKPVQIFYWLLERSRAYNVNEWTGSGLGLHGAIFCSHWSPWAS